MSPFLDASRQRRRLAELAFRDSVLASLRHRERVKHVPLAQLAAAYRALGGRTARAALVTWLSDAARAHHLPTSVMVLAVDYLDHALAALEVSFPTARDLAAICLLLAVKMDATGGDSIVLPTFPGLRNVPVLELIVLNVLRWDLVLPTGSTFLSIFSHRFWIPPRAQQLANEHLKSMLTCMECRVFYPSILAYASLLLLERDRALPGACKSLIADVLRGNDADAVLVAEAMRRFHEHYPGGESSNLLSPTVSVIHSDEEYPSSTTLYPSSASTSSDLRRGRER